MLKRSPLAGVVLALTVAISSQSLPASASQSEPIQTRARDRYVTAMTGLADGYTYATEVAEARGELGMTCPVPSATFVSSFGAPRTGHTHQGVDMMADFGTQVLAPEAGLFEGDGESFYLYADSGTTYFGTHNGGDLVASGSRVTRGQPISTVSNTGNAAGGSPHLHFEIHPGDGPAVDPYPATLEACTANPVTRIATPSSRVAAPTFRYGVMEIHRYWNATHGRIDGRTARTLTRYLNTVVGHRLATYLAAVSSCSEPVSCQQMVRAMAPSYRVNANDAVAVMMCESGGNPNASNGGRFLGLYQHGVSWWADRAVTFGIPGASVFDGRSNAHVTLSMVRDGGWGPWECRP